MAYTKQNFESGKPIMAQQLNKMDAQIAANENNVAQAKAKANEALSRYGGAMNGPLILASPPTEPMQAATKQFVERYVEQAIENIPSPSPGPTPTPTDWNILTDDLTGVQYRLFVADGKLSMTETTANVSARSAGNGFVLTDETTGSSYKIHVSDGNLKMTEVQ